MQIPKWVVAGVGGAFTILATGFMGWMTTMQLSANDMRVRIGQREQAEQDVLRRLDRIEAKLDKVLDR